MTHQLKHDVGIVIDTRMLSLSGDFIEYLIDIREVEIAAEAQILGSPVVATHEGMNVGDAALSCGGIA